MPGPYSGLPYGPGMPGPRRLGTNQTVKVLAESGAGDEAIMSLAGHVSRAMLSRYSHVRMEAKRRALNGIATRQRAAGEKREEEAERREQVAVVSQSALAQYSPAAPDSQNRPPSAHGSAPILRRLSGPVSLAAGGVRIRAAK